MISFRDPFAQPLTGQKLVAVFLYLGLASISIWATAESLKTSFNLNGILSYAIAAALILTLGFLLSIIAEAISNKNAGILLFISLFFFSGWALTCYTNAHKLFTQLKLEDIRKNEMDIASTELSNLSVSALTIGKDVINDYQNQSNALIKQTYDEILNPNNCGFKSIARERLEAARQYIGISESIVPPSNSSCLEEADYVEEKLRTALAEKLLQKNMAIQSITIECDKPNEREAVLLELATCKDRIGDQLLSLMCREKLSNAHEYYDAAYKCINDRLNIIRSKVLIAPKLIIPLPSRELEKFNQLYPFVKENSEYKSSLVISALAAFLIDALMFIILYFVILKNED